MTTASFDFQTIEEIDGKFLRALKTLFRGQSVKIIVEAEDDSYDKFLSENPATVEKIESRLKSPVTHSFNNTDELLDLVKNTTY